MIQKQLKQMTPQLVADLYKVLGIEPPKDRMLNQVVIVVEAGKPVKVQETAYPAEDVEVPDAPQDNAKQSAAAANEKDKPN